MYRNFQFVKISENLIFRKSQLFAITQETLITLIKENNPILLAQRLECSPMARETWVQSQVESYQRL